MTDGIGNRAGWGRQVRLGVAIGTLLAGIVVFASGAAKVGADALGEAGLSSGLAVEVAAAGAAVIPLVIVLAVLATVEAPRRLHGFAVGGGTLMIGGIAVGVTSTTPFANPVAFGLYGGGMVALFGSLVAGVIESSASPRVSDRPTADYVDRRPTDHVMPSDGGEDDDDLEFLLDDEE